MHTNCSDDAVDVAFIVDASGSVNWERMHYVVEFVQSIVEKLVIGPDAAHIGVVYFSDEPHIAMPLDSCSTSSSCVDDIKKTLKYLGGKTNIADAQRKTRVDLFGVTIRL